jgi:hypothetical protein
MQAWYTGMTQREGSHDLQTITHQFRVESNAFIWTVELQPVCRCRNDPLAILQPGDIAFLPQQSTFFTPHIRFSIQILALSLPSFQNLWLDLFLLIFHGPEAELFPPALPFSIGQGNDNSIIVGALYVGLYSILQGRGGRARRNRSGRKRKWQR